MKHSSASRPLIWLLSAAMSVLIPGMSRAEDVAIGAILPLSGSHAAFGHMQRNSMLMAVEEINARGGIGGEKIVLDIRDSAGRARNARAVVDHFVQDKNYPMVLGGFTSSVAAALAEKCEVRRIPLVIITGSEDSITLQDYRYVFRIAPPRSRYPEAALDYARSAGGGQRIFLVTEKTGYGDDMARIVKSRAGEWGWEITGEWRYARGTRNLEELYGSASEAAPDILFLAAFPPRASLIVAELRSRLPDAAVFNLTPVSTLESSYSQCGSSCAGAMNPSLWQPERYSSAARYAENYTVRFASEPDYHGAQAYAAVLVAAQALRRSGAVLAEQVRDALEGVSVNTPYGRVSFRDRGGFTNQNDPPNYLVRFDGEGFEVIWPQDR